MRRGGLAAAEEDSALLELKVVFNIDLHPSRTLLVKEAVRDELNARLMRYDELLGGVMLAYWDEKPESKLARMLDIVPFVSVQVRARVLLFRPEVGATMVGRVNMVGADHVGLLVFNMFNVSISRQDMREELKFVDTAFGGQDRARVESSRHPAHVISSGTDVTFTVTGLNDSEELLSLSGALRERGTGSVAFLAQQGDAEEGVEEEEEDAEEREARRRRKQERKRRREEERGGEEGGEEQGRRKHRRKEGHDDE